MQTTLLYLAALGAGISVAVPASPQRQPSRRAELAGMAGFASYLGGLLTMIVVLVAMREQMPSWKLVTATPWWAWSGGILGGIFILLVILLLPSLGAATLLALVVAARCPPPSSWTISARLASRSIRYRFHALLVLR